MEEMNKISRMTPIFAGSWCSVTSIRQFINSSGGDEGALHMQSFAQAVLKKGLSVVFEGTSERSGQSLISCIQTIQWK